MNSFIITQYWNVIHYNTDTKIKGNLYFKWSKPLIRTIQTKHAHSATNKMYPFDIWDLFKKKSKKKKNESLYFKSIFTHIFKWTFELNVVLMLKT